LRGEWVWLCLHHGSVVGIIQRTNAKLSPKFFGSFQVLERVGALTYILLLPPKSRIHDVFHVVFLKLFEGTPPEAPPHLLPLNHGRVLLVPSRVLHACPTTTSWDVLVF
jgi:hypothetical protein